jgi:hypothetical protein
MLSINQGTGPKRAESVASCSSLSSPAYYIPISTCTNPTNPASHERYEFDVSFKVYPLFLDRIASGVRQNMVTCGWCFCHLETLAVG